MKEMRKKKKEERCRHETERWRPRADKKESGPEREYIGGEKKVQSDEILCGFFPLFGPGDVLL